VNAGFIGRYGSPDAAAQLSNPAGAEQVDVACFGQLYNFAELQGALGLANDIPADTTLRLAWQRWGVDVLPRLDGVFVLAVRDHQGLLLYRDPSGLRDLYAHEDKSGPVTYSSHLAALLKRLGSRPRLSRPSLHEYLRFLDLSAPNTLFEGVRAVEAGQAIWWTRTGCRIWNPAAPAPTPSDAPRDLEAAVERLDFLLRQSISARLTGSVHPAAFLSGGIDSALLCAMAREDCRDLTTLTVGFEGAAFDESRASAAIASHLGLRHEVLRFGRSEYLAAFDRMAHHLEQPSADPALAATVLAFDRCRASFDAVLDGTGADELVGAMPPRHIRLAVAYGSLIPRRPRRALATALRGLPYARDYAPLVDFEHPADTMIRWHGFTRAEIEELCEEPVSFAHTHFYRTFGRFSRRGHFARYSALIDAMPCERLTQAMLLSEAQIHYPYVSRDTSRFLRQLRTEWRYLPGQPKRILRALLARYVPHELWDVPKHGFDFPLQEFLSADDFALVRRFLSRGRWVRTDLLRAQVVARYAEQYISGDQGLKFRVWALVLLGAWLEKHNDLH
jgi:asparagine synthase (glutamine-hydrolysing)